MKRKYQELEEEHVFTYEPARYRWDWKYGVKPYYGLSDKQIQERFPLHERKTHWKNYWAKIDAMTYPEFVDWSWNTTTGK